MHLIQKNIFEYKERILFDLTVFHVKLHIAANYIEVLDPSGCNMD